MVKMKTAICPTCGGMVFKLAGKAGKLCHDECLDCRRKREEPTGPDADFLRDRQQDDEMRGDL